MDKRQARKLVRVRTDKENTTYLGYVTADSIEVTDEECLDEELPLIELESLPN